MRISTSTNMQETKLKRQIWFNLIMFISILGITLGYFLVSILTESKSIPHSVLIIPILFGLPYTAWLFLEYIEHRDIKIKFTIMAHIIGIILAIFFYILGEKNEQYLYYILSSTLVFGLPIAIETLLYKLMLKKEKTAV